MFERNAFNWNSFDRNEPEQADRTKAKKNWLFPKKKASSICASQNVKSPETPVLTEDLIKQLKVLMQFLQKDESELISFRHSS